MAVFSVDEIIPGQPGANLAIAIPEGGGWFNEAKKPKLRTKEEILAATMEKIRDRRAKKRLMLSGMGYSRPGVWRTIRGNHVFIDDETGEVLKGPKNLIGKQAYTPKEKLEQKGGFTLEPRKLANHKRGFAVSIFPEREKRIKLADLTEDDIYDFIKANQDKFKEKGTYVGGWLDEFGIVYLDVSVVRNTEMEATALARKYGQEGIYDLAQGKTIITKAPEERRKALSRHRERPRHDDGRANESSS